MTAWGPEVTVCQIDLIKRVSHHKLEAFNWPQNTDMANMLTYSNESSKHYPYANWRKILACLGVICLMIMGTDFKRIITLFQVILHILIGIDQQILLLHSELRTDINSQWIITMFVIGSSLQVFLHKMWIVFYYHKFVSKPRLFKYKSKIVPCIKNVGKQ